MENYTLPDGNLKLEFTWYDYGLFSSMLILSTLVGVYFGFIKKQSTANDYLLGGKDMSPGPVAMSLIASVISGISLLAVPADIYKYGAAYWFGALTLVLSTVLSYSMCVPVFYELQLTSTYEYLERRFDKSVRIFASALYAFAMCLYLPIVIYMPALALAQATNLNIHSVTPIICGVCVFYTTVGGLKAVVWTDALQFVVMVSTIIVVLFLGVSSSGGFKTIWSKNKEYGRLHIDFSLDATKRDTFWTGTIGTFCNWFSYVACNQGFMQKCIALPNFKAVRRALIIFAFGTMGMISFSAYSGLMIFAKYFDCDPLASGKITQPDQLLPYYVMDIGRAVPGLPGLFTAGVFSAALSTLSACINCLSATIYEDFVSPYIDKNTSEKTVSNYLKILSVIIGIISTALVFFVPYMGSILPVSLGFGGLSNGATVAVFMCGMFFPSINAKGALWGGIISILFMSWTCFKSLYYKMMNQIIYPHLFITTDGCQNFTLANTTVEDQISQTEMVDEPFALYKISFYYYAFMGMMVGIISGLIISKFTSECNRTIDKKYFSPLIRSFIKDDEMPPEYYTLQQQNEIISLKAERLKS